MSGAATEALLPASANPPNIPALNNPRRLTDVSIKFVTMPNPLYTLTISVS